MEPPLGPVIDFPFPEEEESLLIPNGPTDGLPPGPEAPLPMLGEGPSPLDDPQLKEDLERDIRLMLDDYNKVMEKRWEREDEIEEAYALKADTAAVGKYAGASELCSELIMSRVDQATARLADTFVSVQPLCRVTPLDSFIQRRPENLRTEFENLGKAMEQFFENYSRRQLRIEDRMASIAHRTAKVGTCVVRVDWVEKIKPIVAPPDQVYGKKVGNIKWELIANRDVVIWPAWALDWQEDFEWVGHRTHMSSLAFLQWAQKIGVPPQEAEELLVDAETPGEVDSLKSTDAAGYELDAASAEKLFQLHPVIELFTRRVIPGTSFPVTIQVFYHERKRKVLGVKLLQSKCGKHPYFPIRYKRLDQSAWGNGIGHELYGSHVADTAFRNLQIDNLMSAVLSIVITKTSSGAEAQMENPYPGMHVSTDDPEGDIAIQSFAEGGPVELLYQAETANLRRADDASGLPAVLQGQGDPTMKSGAGTGSTLALIQEASKKFGFIDKGMRRDLSDIYAHTFDLLADYADPETFMKYAPPEDAMYLSALKALKPGESVEDLFSMRIEAPSASNNKAIQQQNAMVAWNFVLQTSDAIMNLAQQIFPGMNPAGMIPYLVQWAGVLAKVGQEVIDLQDLPGMRELLPTISQEIPVEQQMINTLMMQLQQLQQELEQAYAMSEGEGGDGTDVGADASSGNLE